MSFTITPMPAHHNTPAGFTLLETIIYVGLFSLIFTGVFVSIYPLLTGAERLTKNVAIEGEAAFILAKLEYILSSTLTDTNGALASPLPGTNGDQLRLTYNGNERYRVALATTGDFCETPLICRMLTIATAGDPAVPLNAQRVQVENFLVQHVAPANDQPRYLDVSFTVNNEPIGPVRYYLHF